jgi:hypothetical protein
MRNVKWMDANCNLGDKRSGREKQSGWMGLGYFELLGLVYKFNLAKSTYVISIFSYTLPFFLSLIFISRK